jgi:hypothetical protein
LVPSIFSIVRPAFVARDVEPPQAPPASEANAAAWVAGGRR